MHYREIPDAHENALDDVLVYAFSPERGPNYEPTGPDRPASFHPRGLYDAPDLDDFDPTDESDPKGAGRADPTADDLTVVCGYYDFSAWIRGDDRDVAGKS